MNYFDQSATFMHVRSIQEFQSLYIDGHFNIALVDSDTCGVSMGIFYRRENQKRWHLSFLVFCLKNERPHLIRDHFQELANFEIWGFHQKPQISIKNPWISKLQILKIVVFQKPQILKTVDFEKCRFQKAQILKKMQFSKNCRFWKTMVFSQICRFH